MTSQDFSVPAPRYPLAVDTLGKEEIRAAKLVLDSGRMTMARHVAEFEREFAKWVGAAHAVMVNSGSSANLLIADSLVRRSSTTPLLEVGDEVLVPGLSWPTTVWPLAQLGLVPVFVDVDPASLAIDLDAARTAVGPRTRAMFLIHPLGRAGDLRAYANFCDEHGLVLIEDCCESLGAHSGGAHVGTVGLASSFSFYFSHHLSTIEGGMIVTNDDSLADDLRSLRAHGWIRDRSDRGHWIQQYPEFDARFLFLTPGYNVRPTDIQGAIGIVQLERLDGMLKARELLASRVQRLLAQHVPWLELIGSDATLQAPSTRRQRAHSWMTLPMRLRANAPASRDDVTRVFETAGVETRPLIAGNLARHPAVARIEHRISPPLDVCDALLRDSFMIGCHPTLDRESWATLEAAILLVARQGV